MIKYLGRYITGAAILLTGILLIGCGRSSGGFRYDPLADGRAPMGAGAPVQADAPIGDQVLHVGDSITVSFQDLVNPVFPIDQAVKEDGSITLIYNQRFQAAGKTVNALEKEIHDRYVPRYFVNMTPTIKTAERFYSVGGEVKTPNRQVYSGRMTVVGAINTAGGFTDYARKSKIQVTRANGKTVKVNYDKALRDPKENLEIFPNDDVHVPKRIF
ncbi:MAG: Polysaccharide biosynthesis/export protein [Pedosphaera sp.]|nr:Polysaccharide biosynthesis/export protein [Pedosphaera sp.]